MFTVEAGSLLAPERLHRQHFLADDVPALAHVNAVVTKLVLVIAVTHSEDETAFADMIQRRHHLRQQDWIVDGDKRNRDAQLEPRSGEHTSELQSLMRISY